MMLAVGGSAPGELDFVCPLQVIDGPNLDAVRRNDVHALGNSVADVSRSDEIPASAVVLDLDFGMPHGIANILRPVRRRFAQRELFLHTRLLGDHSLFCPFLSLDDAILEQLISGRDRAIHGLTLDLNGFATQAYLLIYWRFDNIAAYPDATMTCGHKADVNVDPLLRTPIHTPWRAHVPQPVMEIVHLPARAR
jgi:hypothetical protein